jgi:heme A synthase
MADVPRDTSSPRAYAALGWSVLALTLIVILGGAVVRATGSGAGCGETWPRCRGHLIPFSPTSETLIEFTHRLTTVALAIAIVALIVWTRRLFPPHHRVRRTLWVALGLFVLESLIGASLVVFGWVDTDASIGRALVVPLHLVNTFLLVAALALVAHFGGGGERFEVHLERPWDRRVLGGLVIILVIAASGALNALADTLHEAESVVGGIRAEFGRAAPFLLRLRTVHPVVAVAGGIAVYVLAGRLAGLAGPVARRLARAVQVVVWAQFAIGIANIALLTPLEAQIVHLLAADALWILFVLLGARVLAVPAASRGRGPALRHPVGDRA